LLTDDAAAQPQLAARMVLRHQRKDDKACSPVAGFMIHQSPSISFVHQPTHLAQSQESRMGLPTTPQDAAPAYDDVFGDHPVNRYTPSGSASSVCETPERCSTRNWPITDIVFSMLQFHKTRMSSSTRTLMNTITPRPTPRPDLRSHHNKSHLYRPSQGSSSPNRMYIVSSAMCRWLLDNVERMRSIAATWLPQPSWLASCVHLSLVSFSRALYIDTSEATEIKSFKQDGLGASLVNSVSKHQEHVVKKS
jgi:hypothetical protein